MRAARLIRMVLLLQGRPVMTAAELARELEVSERTVARDAQALSEAGIPVYADRGRAGGYRLVAGYRTSLTGLARTEAEALFLSGLPGALRDMGLADAASAARLKASAALLPSLRDAPRTAAQRFHLDAPAWFHEPRTPALLPAIAEAVWEDRRITARYRRGRDDEVQRELEPYGLVLKAGVWYLCARVAAPDGGAFRVYRLDRFTAVEPAGTSGADEGRFVREEGFDLPAFWAEHAEEFARSILRTEVVVRVSPEGARLLPGVVDPASARRALGDPAGTDREGRVTVTLPVESEEVAHAQLRALGPEAEVLAPASLRRRMAADARRLAALYA
ncbi:MULTISPECIES: YafY family protein [Streptomyces]|uniref:Transcriptional regulator n=2 Tax=Streptomyces griseoaurantiacus TaxID=68213 RepID=F3NRQ4_9ACTN|nr:MULTISPECIES: WYL domain-containing protein [Streptomyces]EGG44238.1 transcriptional regulator [Streptomyces griseoaurantiacus M045]MBA5222453.1 WYL domain-containing protein [Streptomyces griseoaurantiacus]MDX3092726.1 WYL domain-containing protein [Streptomyces sp. ME12-02E]MDX3336284.1 WYL domain-containing protein [Streptomyces sp. ME02-6978a]NJP70668.1 WYL domain-containing protein [Streptomyces sp. C1-2]